MVSSFTWDPTTRTTGKSIESLLLKKKDCSSSCLRLDAQGLCQWLKLRDAVHVMLKSTPVSARVCQAICSDLVREIWWSVRPGISIMANARQRAVFFLCFIALYEPSTRQTESMQFERTRLGQGHVNIGSWRIDD